MSKKVLIIGASGLLGRRLLRHLNFDYEVLGTFFSHKYADDLNYLQLDLGQVQDIVDLVDEVVPDVIVNCSGLTSIEDCEKSPRLARIINSKAPNHIAQLAKKREIKFIHVSTDHFKSIANLPRTETEFVWPINEYGHSKLEGEKQILQSNPESTIIRTNFFGPGRYDKSSFWDFATKSLKGRESVNGFTDVEFSPVGLSYLVEVVRILMDTESSGIINVASQGVISKFEFLQLLASQMSVSPHMIKPSLITEFETLAPRPTYLALNPSRLISKFKTKPPSIESMIEAELRSTT